MHYFTSGIERFSFAGLNPNESACVILYIVSTLWVLENFIKQDIIKVPLIIIEIGLILLIAKTMSRGAAITLLCNSISIWLIHKKSKWQKNSKPNNIGILGTRRHHFIYTEEDSIFFHANIIFQVGFLGKIIDFIIYNPVWRMVLLLCNFGLLHRSAPSYVIQDASIFNRFELWRGSLKLIADKPITGWGYGNTGAAYMNWIQNIDTHILYNGLVNSYLQVGAAWGLPALFVMLIILFWSVKNAKYSAASNSSLGMLCFLLISTWAINSLFSSMLGRSLLLMAPFAALLLALFLNAPKINVVGFSAILSLVVCFSIFFSGYMLAKKDSLSINTDKNGIVSISNKRSNSKELCILFVDEEALGRYFGKELRKFLLTSHYGQCFVLQNIKQLTEIDDFIKANDLRLVILSGMTVAHDTIRKEGVKYALVFPSFLPDSLQLEAIESIIYPEIDRLHYLGLSGINQLNHSKIHMIPFDENFETSWAKYINF